MYSKNTPAHYTKLITMLRAKGKKDKGCKW